MEVNIANRTLTFLQTKLVFQEFNIQEPFKRKRNKNLQETVNHPKYFHLRRKTEELYPNDLDRPLGDFLYDLKRKSDMFYKGFLNPDGDKKFCKFKLRNLSIGPKKGLYLFRIEEEIKYIGKTTSTFRTRINSGYGTISPKNCYLDGQPTNCRINSKITGLHNLIQLYICPLKNNDEISLLEKRLIRKFDPPWNIQSN